jgi:hypothetical protein
MNLRAAIDQGLKMEAQYKDIPESYDEARKALRAAIEQAEKQQDHFRDATEKVDCPRCGHCCPDDTELNQLREQNTMLDAEAAKDEALLRQALVILERLEWKREDTKAAIAALKERLK